jgi:hypothetical protein
VSGSKSVGYTTIGILGVFVHNTSIVQQHKGGTVKTADLLRKLQNTVPSLSATDPATISVNEMGSLPQYHATGR